MIGSLLMDAATTTTAIPVRPEFGTIVLGNFIGPAVTTLIAMATFYWGLKKHQRETSEQAKADRKELLATVNGGVEALAERMERVEDRADAFLPEAKIRSMVSDGCDDLKHKLANERQRISALETFRGQDIERIVKLETNMANIEKSVGRIEHVVENLGKDMGARIDGWADKLATSIREVRNVTPRQN